jgi:hypothetical protein
METKYYLPINSKSLAHYFGSACIMPSRYFQNKPADIQNKFEDFLLLSTNNGTKETDCSLELVLTKIELAELIDIKKGFYLYQKPIPISRVKAVLFSDKNQMEQTIVNISMSTAFVPEKIIKTVKLDAIDTSKLEKPNKFNIKDWSKEIKKFNSFLGGFAMMRLAGEEYMNYSENYFSTLSFFNEVIKNELNVAGRHIDNKFFDAFIGESSFKRLYPIINKVVDENDLNLIAQDERQTIIKDKITRVIDLNRLEKATYIVAVLNTFGVGEESKKKKIDGLILSNFKSEIKDDKSEVIALCYGLNKGYSVFANKYKSGNKEKIVKFQLNSQVDYYTIESLYQYVFNEAKVDGFPYIDSWCPKSSDSFSSIKKSDYQILDVVVIGKKKPKVFSQDYLANLLQRFFQKENEGLFKELFEKIRTTVYYDTLEELKDEIAIKDEEIKRLNIYANKVSILEQDINRLTSLNLTIKKNNTENQTYFQNAQTNKTKVEEPLNEIEKNDNRSLVKQVLNYKEKNKTMLEKEAKDRGIIVPKGLKLDDLIILLMTTPKTTNDSTLQFPE